MQTNHIKAIFLGADLRCQHAGLKFMALKRKINIETLLPGEHIIFLNNAKNKLKMYSCNQVVSYLRLDHGTIDLRTIQAIPECFTGSGQAKVSYENSVLKLIQKKVLKQ